MIGFVATRLLQGALSLLVVVTLIFIAVRAVPGDPAQLVAGDLATAESVARIRHEMGLDQPILKQWVEYVSGLVRGDLGVSKVFGGEAGPAVFSRLPATLLLSATAMLAALLVAMPLGIISALRPGSVIDLAGAIVAVLGISIPSFWMGLMLVTFVATHVPFLPVAGSGTWRHLLLPVLALAPYPMAMLERMIRSSMLDILNQDFVRVARAKGLPNPMVVVKHALRNAVIPTLTVGSYQFGVMMGGAIVIESVFAWPGMGLLLLNSVNARDYTMLQGITVIFAATFVIINLVTDLLYVAIDPRLRHS